VAETQGGNERPDSERAPAAPELLRAALEKVVFFEWRLGEMAAELAAAQSRAASADLERARVAQQRAEAEREAEQAREHARALEAERERLASLLARPTQAAADRAAAQAERAHAAQLGAELAQARAEIERQRAERDRWLDERLAQALGAADAEGSLASFISELRGEVIALRERQKQCDELLRRAGIAPPALETPAPPVPAPRQEAVDMARELWAQGRLSADVGLASAARTVSAAPRDRGVPGAGAAPARPAVGAAATALAEQCLRGLSARDPARREQAARHLAAMPVPAAAPALASALGTEPEPRVRAQIALALVACGGGGAADLVVRLQSAPEPLVRLSALDALCSLSDRAAAALETAARDESPAVRRRAAAIAATLGLEDIRARLTVDAEATVRAATTLPEPPAPPAAPAAAVPAEKARATALRAVAPVPAARDVDREAVLAVQTAIFGLTESELSAALSLSEAETSALVAALVGTGRLARRGKRLVAAAGAGDAAQGGP
jgi:hypothetical protein